MLSALPEKKLGQLVRNKRKLPRTVVKEVGRIVVEDVSSIQSCIIMYISETGARLLVNSVSDLPECFLLFRKSKRSLHEAVVVRRELKCVGVRFQAPLDLASRRVETLRKFTDLASIFAR